MKTTTSRAHRAIHDKPPSDESPLSPYRAFVVQLREHADVGRNQWVGRVEHVTSGQATHFRSLEELVAFIGKIVALPINRVPER
jgi:hypothetical protein